jgi:YHS domain-containing protein
MTLILWIVRILVALIILRLVMRFIGSVIAGASGAAKQPPGRAKQQERLGGTLVRDPHCGTYIPQDGALSSGSGGSTVFFCSTNCRDMWALAQRKKASS